MPMRVYLKRTGRPERMSPSRFAGSWIAHTMGGKEPTTITTIPYLLIIIPMSVFALVRVRLHRDHTVPESLTPFYFALRCYFLCLRWRRPAWQIIKLPAQTVGFFYLSQTEGNTECLSLFVISMVYDSSGGTRTWNVGTQGGHSYFLDGRYFKSTLEENKWLRGGGEILNGWALMVGQDHILSGHLHTPSSATVWQATQ